MANGSDLRSILHGILAFQDRLFLEHGSLCAPFQNFLTPDMPVSLRGCLGELNALESFHPSCWIESKADSEIYRLSW